MKKISFISKYTILKNLISFKGIGKKIAFFVCKKCSLLPYIKANILTEKQKIEILNSIEFFLTRNHIFWGIDFIKKKNQRKSFLISLNHFQGFRLKKGLPVNGQRTKTNAKTAKKIK